MTAKRRLITTGQTTRWFHLVWALALLLSACDSQAAMLPGAGQGAANSPLQAASQASPAAPSPTPYYSPRPLYSPGELVDYVAQTGDTLAGLAARFNTSIDEILQANSFIPPSATTMPPGMPMKMPIYYLPLWGSPYKIIPDSLFVDGPSQVGFDTQKFIESRPGWLKNYVEFAADANRTGAQIVDYTALYYSVSPRLLLALLEYQAGALSKPSLAPELQDYPLGYRNWDHKGLFMQMGWAANLLNNGYYGYRKSKLTSLTYPDGRLERLDPWLNAATASLHNYFNTLFAPDGYAQAISPDGFAQAYRSLFGDPWQNEKPHLPGSLVQPELALPFQPGVEWAFTGGPHTGWGKGEPYAAMDFAPPSVGGGCLTSNVWETAVTDGLVIRSEPGVVVIDLDGDGDERTGWVIFYLHVATDGRVVKGAKLKRGDPIGHPSCEGGEATGTHLHIARKYNGEWIPAAGFTGGILAFNMEGWIAHDGSDPYEGTLTRYSDVVTACQCSNQASFIHAQQR